MAAGRWWTGWARAACCGPVVLVLGLGESAAAQIVDSGQQTYHGSRAELAAAERSAESVLPPNLQVPERLMPLVTKMWTRSVTFRRQCARVAEQPLLRVDIELVVGVRDANARSLVTRDHAEFRATVQLEWRRPGSYVELLAHELEHVLEQLDGIDLPRLAQQGVDGVVREGRRYETARARGVGRAVAAEVLVR